LVDGISELAQKAVATGNYDIAMKLITIISNESANKVDRIRH